MGGTGRGRGWGRMRRGGWGWAGRDALRAVAWGIRHCGGAARCTCDGAGVIVVARVPWLGPVPPPYRVVTPEARASGTSCGQMKCTCVSRPPAVTMSFSPDERGNESHSAAMGRIQRQPKAIRGHQMSCHQRQSEAIIGNPRPSEAIRSPARASVIRGNQRPSEAIRGNQITGESLDHQRPSEAIRGNQITGESLDHQRQSEAIRGNQITGESLGSDSDGHAGRHAGHHVRIARLADAHDAVALDANVRLDATEHRIEDQRIRHH